MTAPTAHLVVAAAALGIPVSEVASGDEHEAGYLVVTTDGQGYVLGDGILAYAWPPTPRYAGTFPVWESSAPALADVEVDDDGDTGGITDDDDAEGLAELAELAELSEDDLTALELLAEEGLTAEDVIALATPQTPPAKPTPAEKPAKPGKAK